MKKQVLLVDDHPMMRHGLAQVIALEADLAVCGHAVTAAQGLEGARKLSPDLIVTDISLEGSNGLDLIRDLRAFVPKVPVLVFSMHDELVYAERVLRAGARGYVMKMERIEQVLAAMRRLLRGEFYVSEAVTARSVQRMAYGQAPPAVEGKGVVDALSDRELQIFRLVGQGKGTRVIAGELHISVKTVETHREHLKQKLQLPDGPAVVRFAIEWSRFNH